MLCQLKQVTRFFLPGVFAFIMLILVSGNLNAQGLPITSYDYATPENYISPISMGTGAFNLTNGDDPFAAYTNPALLGENQLSSFALSFRLSNPDDIEFWEAVNISNALKGKQFTYFVLNTKQVSFSYQPVASLNLSEITNNGTNYLYYDYKLDKLQMSVGAKDTKYQKLSGGVTVKYLSGRLVYLKEHIVGVNLVRDEFIDNKVKGFSTDLGFTFEQGNLTYAGTFYDVLSRLWWEDYDSVALQRRAAMGMGWDSGSSHYNVGVQSKIGKTPDTTYHLGYGYQWDYSSAASRTEASTRQTMDVRLGLYSHDFYGADNINYTIGGGYYYKTLRFDFSLNNKGLKLADSQYLFALSLGI